MNSQISTVTIPSTLPELEGFSMPCSCGRDHSIDTRMFVLEKNGLERLPDAVRMAGEIRKVGLLVDRITYGLAGAGVETVLRRMGLQVQLYQLGDGEGGRPHATWENVLEVERWLNGCELIVGVGSGTVNDLAKLPSYRLGVPYIIVPTAPSMNGYTSAIAAIMKDGLKRTVDCHQPLAVVGDLDVLCTAPAHLVAAGLGDLESKPVCTADFRLSSIVRGTYYCSVPGDLVKVAEKRAADAASGLSTGDPDSIAALSEALLLSGCSMKVAGSSSPASGGEHLISHFWDMTAPAENRVEGYHGLQVGVATVVTASLYQQLASLDPGEVNVDRLVAAYPSKEQMVERISLTHGAWATEAVDEYVQKHLDRAEYEASLLKTVKGWSDIWSQLDMLRTPSEIRNTLSSAGAPLSMKELGLTPEHLKRSYLMSREIRGRYTVLDFAFELGVLESSADTVLNSSRCNM